jgi:hypothetical protein
MPRSAHGDERNGFVLFIAVGARSPRIEHRPAVHQEPIPVMAVRQRDLNHPPAIVPRLHGDGVPMIEIAGDLNGGRVRRAAKEVDRFVRIPGRTERAAEKHGRGKRQGGEVFERQSSGHPGGV